MNNTNDTGPKRPGRVLISLPDELRGALQREAFAHSRTLTAEINLRLRDSLKAPGGRTPSSLDMGGAYSSAPETPVAHVKEPGQKGLTELQRSMLKVFDRLPPEKQLALLSLFK